MSKLLDGLNLSQREAVTHKESPLLIIAGPGSGKTHTVARSIAYAVENGTPPNKIVAFTFTRKARSDLKNRVNQTGNTAGQDLANNVWISTFHSFCGRVVKEDFDPFGIENEGELTVKELILLEKERVRAEINYIQHRNFPEPDDVLRFITRCKERNINSAGAKDYVPDPQMVDVYIDIKKKYEQLNDDGNPYTRVQLLTNALFRDFSEVRRKWQEKFDLIFVDEYQDTDPVQYQIIKTLAKKHQNLRVVGDDDQGIYGWRGANIQNILNFEKDYPNAKVISLGQNYRSTPQIVDASRAIIDFNPDRRTKNLFTNNTKGYKVKHLHCEDRVNEAATIADFIHRAIQQGWTARDFAVLCRSTKGQAIYFEEAFSKSGIPSHVIEDSSEILTNRVPIMTIHKSKGLEFPNVFVAGVCAGLLPFNSKEEDWDEELRLLYVAMTRAENWLCLSSYEKDSSDKNTSFKRGPSRFLDFIPPSLIENIKTLDNTLIPSRLKKRIVVEDTEKSPKDATSLPIRPQIVLGIDPGKENVGWSITQRLPDAYTVFRCDTEKPYRQTIERKINELVMRHSPDAIAVEKLEGAIDEWFRDVAGCIAQIRSIADQRGIECHFYSPQDVKYAVTGNRNASKEEVELAVKRVCILKEIPKTDHSADAIAASLCYLRNYLNYSRFQNTVRKQEHYNSGLTYLDDKRYNEAIVEFKKAINNASMIDPMYTKAHCGLARTYIGQDKLEEAENSANEAIRLDPNYQPILELQNAIKQAYYERGMAYLNDQQYDSAITAFNEVVRIDSNFIKAYCGLGWAYLGRDNLKFAENSTKTVPDIEENYDFWEDIMDYPKQNDLVSAENSVNEALKLEACYQPALELLKAIKQEYVNKGNDYLSRDELDTAEKTVKEALRLDPNYQPALELLKNIKQVYVDKGNNCLRQNKLDKAEKVAKEALRLDSNYQPARDLLNNIKQKHHWQGLAYIKNKEYAKAIKPLLKVRNIDQSEKENHANLGRVYYFLDDYAKAAACYRKAANLDPMDKTIFTNIGNAYYWMEEYDKAVESLLKARSIELNCEKTRYYLGRTYFKLDLLEEAKQEAEKALDITPTYQPALELLDQIKRISPALGDEIKLRTLDAAMVLIPASEFQIGNRKRTVYLDNFHIDKYPVTNAQYKKFLEANPQWRKDHIRKEYHDGSYLKHWSRDIYPKGKGNHPVVYVSWYAAMAYAQWIGKRLPTEAEWEKAARGGLIGKKYPWGNSIDSGKANYGSNIYSTTSVDVYPPNDYDLYDMVGNVWEWCLDKHDLNFHIKHRNIPNTLHNFTSVKSSRALRGGSWESSSLYLEVTHSEGIRPSTSDARIGFRCVHFIIP